MRRNRHNFGFTLVELVLLLVIIAVVCMIAAPAYDGFAKGRLGPNAAMQFAATTRWCHEKAVRDGVTYRLNIDTQSSCWWCTRDDGTGQNFTEVKDDEMGVKYTMADGVTIEPMNLAPNDQGLYLEFGANGENTPARFRFHYRMDNYIDVACDSPVADYHVIPPGGKS